ncbi:MAG: homocysteine S-methyltransferase family protein [Alphaproteobacteria bacterium]|nr:homocysteine S-methyltransferase family protein [Alphaproteobacteria bacterium]
MSARITILDGPLGTELLRRGVALPAPAWSAAALGDAPDVVAAIHREYAAAGATVHTTCTFRTQPRWLPDWRARVTTAVGLARGAVPAGHRVAGSIAPIFDCYRPDLSPPEPGPEHARLAQALVEEGVDLLLCETFPNVGEGLAAVDAAVLAGAGRVPVWAAFTPGPDGDLLSPEEIAVGCREAAARGAAAVLVNCLPATSALRWLQPVLDLDLGLPVGIYANAGHACDGLGWGADPAQAAARYVELARQWVAAGATLVGACCGTTPATIAALAQAFRTTEDR